MQIHRWTRDFRLAQDCGLIIGNFDGVHRGHQAMLARLQAVCAQRQLAAVAMSFFPHPRSLVQGQAPALLSSLRDRAFWLSQYGISDWLLVPFTPSLRQTSAQDFLQRFLCQSLQPRYLLVGDDFRFGYKGLGDFHLLGEFAAAQGMMLEAVDTVMQSGQRISSSAVRSALAAHDLATAQDLLGHALTFTGRVRAGDGRGRNLAARTANVHLPLHWSLPNGVYVVQMRLCAAADTWHWGVANVGAALTFASQRRKLEVHLLDVQMDLYGQVVQVAFRHYLRPVQKFETSAALQAQIQHDIQAARDFIAASFH